MLVLVLGVTIASLGVVVGGPARNVASAPSPEGLGSVAATRPSIDPALLDFARRPDDAPAHWAKMSPMVQEAVRSDGTMQVFVLTDDVNALGAFLRASGVPTRVGSVPSTRERPVIVTVDVSTRILEKIAAQGFVYAMAAAVSPEPPVAADPDLPTAVGDGPAPTLLEAGRGHHVPEAWDLGYTGAGVRVSALDSGTDFGHPDLQGTYARNTDPASPYFDWPMAFDPTSMDYYMFFDAIFPQAPSWYVDTTFATAADPVTGLTLTPFEGRVFNVSGIPSASGLYRLGLHPDFTLALTYGNFVPVLVTDSSAPSVYDTVYVNLDNDTNFFDDKPVSQASPESWADYYDAATNTWDYTDYTSGDGMADTSGGLVYFIADGNPIPYSDVLAGIYGLPLAIPAAGDLVAFQIGDIFVAAGDHGTLVASSIVGQNVTGLVQGFAPDAELISVGNWYSSFFFWLDAFPFVGEGYDGIPGTGDEAHIASGSFGFSALDADGWDLVSRWVELWSYAYSDTTFLISSGNGAHGLGTVTAPGSSPGVIAVGASTSYNAFGGLFELANHSTFGDVQPWSGRGPSALGQTKPDVVTVGAWATGDGALNSFGGATPVVVWGGTSLAAPAAGGILALAAQAWMDSEGTNLPNPIAKAILVGSADNIHYDPQVMGHGITNAYRAVQSAASADGLVAWNTDGFAPAPALTAGDYRGSIHTSFARLVSPGSATASSFTVFNRNSAADKDVTIADWELRRVGSDVFFINATNAAESIPEFTRPDYVIDLTGMVPETTDLLAVTVHHPLAQLDPNGDLVFNSRWRVLVYDWLDYNGNGEYWNDADGNGVVNAGEMDETMGPEIMRFTYGYPTHTILQAYVQRPLERMHDGLLLGVQHRTVSPMVPFTNLTITVEYFEALDAPWIATDTASATIPAGGSIDLGVTITLPPSQPLGTLSGVITISDGASETQIPVIANVAATGTDFRFGGDGGSDAFLDNNRIQGGVDWTWRPEAGDWRFFFLDVADETPIAPGDSLLVHTWWEQAQTDIDTIVFGPTPDPVSDLDPNIWGNYTLSTVGASVRTWAGAGRWPFQTATGRADEWVTAPLAPGLHEIALHNVMYAGESRSEVFEGQVGTFHAAPVLWEVATADGAGSTPFSVRSSLDLPGLEVVAYGLSAPRFNPAIPIQDQGDYVETFTAEDIGVIDIRTAGPPGLDIDLFLFRQIDGLPVYELVGVSAGVDATERIRLERPADGNYLIDVFGFSVPGGTAMFSLYTSVVEGLRELVPSGVPTGPIPAGTEVAFDLTWDIDFGTRPGVYEGIVFVGLPSAPVTSIPALFVLTDAKAPGIGDVVPAEGASTNDNRPTIEVFYADEPISAGIVDVTFTLDGFDLSEMGTFDQFRFVLDPPFALGDGTYRARITVYDGAGHNTTRAWSFTVDTAGPAVSLTAPTATLTNAATASYAGRTEPGSTVSVNGVSVTVGADGSFSGTIALAEGPNTITAVATDAAGNAATATRTITRDSVAPALTVTSPAAGSRIPTNVVRVSGTTEAGASVSVNGLSASVAESGAWSMDLALEFGSRTITIIATDAAGNPTTVTRTVEVGPAPDTVAPVVTVTAPAEGATTSESSLVVSGTVNDPAATVFVNEIAVRPATDGTWSVSLSLSQGANTIRVSAVDSSGNRGAEVTRTVTYESPIVSLNDAVAFRGNLVIGLLIVVAAMAVLVVALYGNMNRKIERLRPKPPEKGSL